MDIKDLEIQTNLSYIGTMTKKQVTLNSKRSFFSMSIRK